MLKHRQFFMIHPVQSCSLNFCIFERASSSEYYDVKVIILILQDCFKISEKGFILYTIQKEKLMLIKNIFETYVSKLP